MDGKGNKYLDTVDVDVVAQVPGLVGSNVGNILNVHQHAAQQLVQLAGSGGVERRLALGGAVESALRFHDVMTVRSVHLGPLHDARHHAAAVAVVASSRHNW